MSTNLLKIPIQRFEAGRAVSCDVYLHLPLNKKTLRIAMAGQELSADLLARLRAKGHGELSVSWISSTGNDPSTYPIYLDPTIAAIEAALPIEQSPAEPLNVTELTTAATESVSIAEATEPPAIAKNSELIEPTEIQTNFKPDAEVAAQPENTFSADPQEVEPTQSFSKDEEKLHSTKIKAGKTEKDLTQSVFGAEKAQQEKIQKFSSKTAPVDNSAFKFSAGEKKEEEPVAIFGKSPETPLKEMSLSHPEALRRQDDKAKKAALVSAKISERIKILAEKVGDDSALNQMDGLLAALEASESGEELPVELIESLEKDPLPTAPANPQEQKDALELERAALSRDLPATASRLAAYLGHSLGYSNIDFLADVGAGAVIHFVKKEGTTINENALPRFVKEGVLPNEQLNSQVDDFKKILEFLDLYLTDPECDRSLRDLDKKVFYKTIATLEKKSVLMDPWSANCWSVSVEKGPTLESHSLCTKASAKAIKTARSAYAE